MRYIYFDPEVKTITITNKDSGIYGEQIGTNKNWRECSPGTKKVMLTALMRKAGYQNLTGLTINDCDAPKTTPPVDP